MLLESSKKVYQEKILPLFKHWYMNYKDRAAELKADLRFIDNEPPYLKNRVVWCFNCAAKRQLTTIRGSSLIVCATCYGHNWEHFTNKYFIPYEIVVTNTVTGERKQIL